MNHKKISDDKQTKYTEQKKALNRIINRELVDIVLCSLI